MAAKTHEHPVVVADRQCRELCNCGGVHPAPGVTLYAAADATAVLAADYQALHGQRELLLLSDPLTHAVAGIRVLEALCAQGVAVDHLLLGDEPSATEELAESVRAKALDKELIVAVGAGTVNDLAKYAADRNDMPYWVVPTAPSMNGFTSSISAVKVKGVKLTVPAAPPQRIYAEPQVIREAPLKLRQAGFCDVLAKVVSDVDWQISSRLFDGDYCRLPSKLLAGVEETYSDHPEAIGHGDALAVQGLFFGLLVSGVAMSLAGSSAPASGGEHLVSHFWDMREPLTGRIPELHGLQVGAGIILSAACYARLAQRDGSTLSGRAEDAFEATAARIPLIWGGYADEVGKQFLGKREQLLGFDTLLPQHWPELAALFRQVKTPHYFLDLFRRTGFDFSLDSLRLSAEEFLLAARNGRAIRSRITVLDLAAHAGVLEAAAEETLALLS
jgi:glycerol-1-phosphate dehydrogenase [NAD(P)+]